MFFRNTLQRHKPKHDSDSNLIFDANGIGGLSISSRSEPYYEDDLYSRFSNGDFDDDMNDHNAPLSTESVDEKTGLELLMENGGSELVDGDTICLCVNGGNNDNSSDNLSFDGKEKDATDGSIGETEILNPFSDLTGDYDAHIRNLLYSQGCHGYALSTTMGRASPSPPTSPYGNKNRWDSSAAAHSWPVPFQRNVASQVNGNGVAMGHPKHINGSNRNPGNAALRGTGPYIPVVV